jgi:uncharacterized membrane protein YraQ (UPF0718 family)
MKKFRKGIALFDVLIALVIITIIGIVISKYIIGINNIKEQMDLESKFENIVTLVENSFQKTDNVMFYTLTPRGIISPDASSFNLSGETLADFYNNNSDVIYFNYEKALYGCYSDTCNADETAPWGKGITDSNKDLFSNFYNFTLYHFDAENNGERLKKQEAFLQIPLKDIRKYGDSPLIFVIQRYSEYH